MKLARMLQKAWRAEMSTADRVRVVLALCFPVGALGHFLWVGIYGLFYHGPAPSWAVWFWYSLCGADFIVAWLMLARPRIGLVLGVATMAFSLYVNWRYFPTFEFGPNFVLLILTAFGITLAVLAPWLWFASRWRLRVA